MKRQQIIQSFFQNMDALRGTANNRPIENLPKGMPTHSQMGILFVLNKEAQSIKELAGRFHTSSSAVTQLVNDLVGQGLLVRHEDKFDRRKISVGITEKGRKKMLQAKKMHMKFMEKMFEPLSDAELLQLQRMQQKMVDHLKILWNRQKPHNQ